MLRVHAGIPRSVLGPTCEVLDCYIHLTCTFARMTNPPQTFEQAEAQYQSILAETASPGQQFGPGGMVRDGGGGFGMGQGAGGGFPPGGPGRGGMGQGFDGGFLDGTTYSIPADKCGLVLGKGGETIREINRQSGALVELDRNPPPNPGEKIFNVHGNPQQIQHAIQLICEKAGLNLMKIQSDGQDPMAEKYIAAMVLAGVGDALGYKGGEWEFCYSGRDIHEELHKLGGLNNIKVNKKEWRVSDDTVMHLATAEALIDPSLDDDKANLYSLIAGNYKTCMSDMAGRAPGATCIMNAKLLKPEEKYGYRIPFNSRGGGCGAAMRAMCIGLRYPRPEDLDDLIAVGIESGRMTHHNPTGYLGSMTAALFTAYSIQSKPPVEWGPELLQVLEKAKAYIRNEGHCSQENLAKWSYFQSSWKSYVDNRQLRSGAAVFPPDYDTPEERDKFYKAISFNKWGGSGGHDSTIIAYDAILGAGNNWEELCKRGVFHGGDNDSTGTIAACCYGAMYGFDGVPQCNYEKLEYRDRMERAGQRLFELTNDSKSKRVASKKK